MHVAACAGRYPPFFHSEPQPMQYPIAPDLAVYRGVAIDAGTRRQLRSWRLYEPGRPPPRIVFEVASEATWRRDFAEKPDRYAEIGVEEYVLYDPNEPALLPDARLRLWCRTGSSMQPVAPDAQGRVRSAVLERYLVSDEAWLRLTDRNGIRCPTVEEAERAGRAAERSAKEAAWAKLRELGIDPKTLDS